MHGQTFNDALDRQVLHHILETVQVGEETKEGSLILEREVGVTAMDPPQDQWQQNM